jgi:hypothetical protein
LRDNRSRAGADGGHNRRLHEQPRQPSAAPAAPLTPAEICRLLATGERLRVVAALALGATSREELADATGLLPRDLIRSLNRLVGGGLVEADGKGGWWLRATAFAEAARAVAEASEDPAADHGAADPREAAVLRTFMPGGQLVALPAGHAKRRIVLDQVARLFEPGQRYPEREVNALLRAVCAPAGAGGGQAAAPVPDHVTLRRYLVDGGYLTREAGVYWRSGGTFDIDEPDTEAPGTDKGDDG